MSGIHSAEPPIVLSADSPPGRFLYAGGMFSEAVRQLWAEPRVPNAPRRVWRDWVLVGPVVPVALLEVILRKDLGWPPVAFVLAVIPAFMLLWRRTHPLAAVAIGFGAHAASEAVTIFGAPHSAMLYVSAVLVVLPYALFRWASGRDCAIGLAVILLPHVPHGPFTWGKVFETAIGSIIFLLFPAALGAAMRYRTSSKVREMDQIKLRERELLARELHDTVAHHVSAIIIQAQAGRTVAAANPDAALKVLAVIEAEALRTLAEMRVMVGALRHGEDADLFPQRGVADIERLALGAGDGPRVDVQLSGALDDLGPSVGAAIYRLAQESITNAIRHARHATRIDVSVTDEGERVRLTVRDDGEHSQFGANASSGYGLVGMTERATLLGGTLEAGPGSGRGWTITAVLPRNGVPA
jgi:signal transduction histidine kinase